MENEPLPEENENEHRSGVGKFLFKTALLAGGVWAAGRLMKPAEPIDVKGKVVLITGGSRGLGLVMARQLAKDEARVVICGRSDESLRQAQDDLSKISSEVLALECDVSDKNQVKRMMDQIRNRMGEIDILINNASVIQIGPMETMSDSDFEYDMKVHFWGPYHLMKEVLPYMKEKQRGRIVNIVSVGGRLSVPHLLPYSSSKFALAGFSEGMSNALKKDNIKVTTVYPGLMRTGSPRNIDVKGQHEKEYAWFKIADSLPGLSIAADKAAERILDAMKTGKRTLTLTVPAKVAVAAHAIVPGFTNGVLALANRLMPGGESQESKKGHESESSVSSSRLTQKTDEAADYTLQKHGE